nr:MAG: cytochrome c biogenesis protein [Candidatus Nanosalinarum sp. J07AB56]
MRKFEISSVDEKNYVRPQLVLLGLLVLVSLPGASAQASGSESCFSFFYSPTCPHCDTVESYVEQDGRDYTFQKYAASRNTEKFAAYIRKYDVPARQAGSVPTLFSEKDYAVGSKNSIELINRTVNSGNTSECPKAATRALPKSRMNVSTGPDPPSPEKGSVKAPAEELPGLAGVAALAVTDSINPCAIAVLLVLMGSILGENLENQRRAALSGLAFVGGVFSAYLLMGVILVAGVKGAAGLTSIGMESIYSFFGVFAILAGALNLKDWYSHGLGGFAVEVPFSWRPKMKSYLRSVTGPAGAFAVSLLVSLFLLPCTSGPYFVAGGMLADMSWSAALPLLAAYNLIFVAPMLGILGAIALTSTQIEEIKDWRENNIERLHLIAGLILIGLGLFLLL